MLMSAILAIVIVTGAFALAGFVFAEELWGKRSAIRDALRGRMFEGVREIRPEATILVMRARAPRSPLAPPLRAAA